MAEIRLTLGLLWDALRYAPALLLAERRAYTILATIALAVAASTLLTPAAARTDLANMLIGLVLLFAFVVAAKAIAGPGHSFRMMLKRFGWPFLISGLLVGCAAFSVYFVVYVVHLKLSPKTLPGTLEEAALACTMVLLASRLMPAPALGVVDPAPPVIVRAWSLTRGHWPTALIVVAITWAESFLTTLALSPLLERANALPLTFVLVHVIDIGIAIFNTQFAILAYVLYTQLLLARAASAPAVAQRSAPLWAQARNVFANGITRSTSSMR